MDVERIKRKSCLDYLLSRGFEPESKSNSKYSFFKSPFRNETIASLAINNDKNTWFDYGAGFGGDVIKLVELVENVSFKEAVSILSGESLDQIVPKKNKSSIEVVDTGRIRTRYLLDYLIGRKIDVDIAREYCVEIDFKSNNKIQKAIGFENNLGGFEIRNKYLKISTSPKWFTTINHKGEQTSVFEGFIDFLSLLTAYQKHPKDRCIILNGVSMIDHVDDLDGAKFFGDNDESGDECFSKIPDGKDVRYLYKGYKDINDWLVESKQRR